MSATLKDVVKMADVSVATDSLALNDSNLVNKDSKKRVKEIAKKLEYQPNVFAQRLVKKKSFSILVLLNQKYFIRVANIYYLRVIGGMIVASDYTDYNLVFSFFEKGTGDDIPRKISSKNNDGILIFNVVDEVTLRKIIGGINIHFELVSNHKNFPEIFGVDNDDFMGAYKSVKYLYGLGHRDIGFFGIPVSYPFSREGYLGFKKAMEELNLSERCLYFGGDLSINSGRLGMEDLIKK